MQYKFTGEKQINMIFDITTQEKALDFLASFLKIDAKLIKEFAFSATTYEPYRHDGDLDIDAFLAENEVEFDKISIDNMQFVAIHVTTDDDNCSSIKKLGIINLQEALIQDTPLKRYLAQNHVSIDIKNHTVSFLGKIHFLDYNPALNSFEESLRYYLNRIAKKVYEDYAVNGFFCCNDIKEYGARLDIGPEFLLDISNLHRSLSNIRDKWSAIRQCYIIKYKAPFEQFQKMNFYDDNEEIEDESQIRLKMWMVKAAFESIKDCCYNEIFAYMDSNETIMPNQIIKIEEYKG